MSGRKSSHNKAIIQSLLSEIYNRYQFQKQFDSSTETCLSDNIHINCSETLVDLTRQQNKKFQIAYLKSCDPNELETLKMELDERITVMSTKLVRQLKQRNRLRDKHKRNCDTITAILQAVSQKRRVDTKLRFNLKPLDEPNGFKQWRDALRAVVRLPGGMPSSWRKRNWLCLADNYLEGRGVSSEDETLRRVFSDRVCDEDESLGNQIVKDLHRTGYNHLTSPGSSKQNDRLMLKRVLLAYARWNKEVGYCQGFNVLASLILLVTEGDEVAAFKIMVYLVDGVLPENYFAHNLQALSVDMAVFRDLLRLRLPQLSKHLDDLQKEANENPQGSSYEPPLTNVFTMQWFLTLFATCLPTDTVLRIWDGVMLDGNEILLRVSLSIWSKLGEKIGATQSADEFYCEMSVMMQDAVNNSLVDADELLRMSYRVAVFPFPHLDHLREKYTYNITPFAAENSEHDKFSSKKQTSSGGTTPDPDTSSADYDEDKSFFCLPGLNLTNQGLPGPKKTAKDAGKQSLELAANRDRINERFASQRGGGMVSERMSTNIAALKNQYMTIRSRQLNAHLVYSKPDAVQKQSQGKQVGGKIMLEIPVMVNHLLVKRKEPVQDSSLKPIQFKERRRNKHKNKKVKMIPSVPPLTI